MVRKRERRPTRLGLADGERQLHKVMTGSNVAAVVTLIDVELGAWFTVQLDAVKIVFAFATRIIERSQRDGVAIIGPRVVVRRGDV